MSDTLATKRTALEARLRELGDLVVAFSGGVDSSVLLHAAGRVLGPRAVGFIADSPSLPRRELEEARAFADHCGVRLVVHQTNELERPEYRANRGDRCYFCKYTLFEAMVDWARAHGFQQLAFGAITDDENDVRPGARAAEELAVVAPLLEAGFSKRDVRAYAEAAGLAVSSKPASACLASRIPVGTPVTRERLRRVELAEARLASFGFGTLRVRDRVPVAGVEVGALELERARALRGELEERLYALGYRTVEIAAYGANGSVSGLQ